MNIDLAPAANRISRIAAGVRDDQLDQPTPCTEWTVTDLAGHLLGLTQAFTFAAEKRPFPGDATAIPELTPGWRTELDSHLDVLVEAWRDPAAWEGEASAGGVTMPADIMGVVALDELVLHGWDLARATGQPYDADPAHVSACLAFAESMSRPGDEASREGLYGPVIPTPPDASEFERLLGYAGREPRPAR